jgi:hypothetical protein
MCVNVLSKTSFLSLFSTNNQQPLKKQPKKKPKNNRNCAPHKKKRFLEARKNNRQREREREREREEHRRADVTEKESGEMIKLVAAKVLRLFSSLVLVFVFSTFFSSS